MGPSTGASGDMKNLLETGLGPARTPQTSTLIITETKFATGRCWALGPSAPGPPAAPGSAVAFLHGSLASAAPFPVLQTGVPVSAAFRGLER